MVCCLVVGCLGVGFVVVDWFRDVLDLIRFKWIDLFGLVFFGVVILWVFGCCDVVVCCWIFVFCLGE